MLKHLHIQNYALIDSLDIDFETGFSVITGETGAGKSILLGAIGLLLGQRADTRNIMSGASRCTVEAEFGITDGSLNAFFDANELDHDGSSCIIRRELTASGKSRAFINDTPASLSQLKELGNSLIDIHSQHQNLLLGKENFQLNVLDIVANDNTLLAEYGQTYKRYRKTEKELDEVRRAIEKEQNELDYILFQHNQLDEAKLHPGEQEELEAEQRTLEHAEEIRSQLLVTHEALQGEESGIVSGIRGIQRRLDNISAVYPEAEELSKRMESCYIELKDIANEIEDGIETTESDPERLEEVSNRLSVIYGLQHKHHANTVEDLLKMRDDLERRINLMENRDELVRRLENELADTEKELREQAGKLSASRKRAATVLENGMCARLKTLGMPNIRFKAEVLQADDMGTHGADNVQFSFSANRNSPLQPISQTASGGEISRVMLSLKATVGNATRFPTIIFDEIDTGVSGHIAESIARIMQEMSKGGQCQVIAITHLPQIAALGSHHYRVFKEESKRGAASRITLLNGEERVEELAHMLSGSVITQAAIDNAKNLLSQ